jgi:hypothetical protein
MGRIANPDAKTDEWTAVKERWGDFWIKKRDYMLEEFSNIISRASLACVGAVVDATAYRKIQTEDDCTLVHSDSNVFTFHHVIMGSIEKIEVVDKVAPIAIIVDDDPEHAFDYYSLLETLRKHPNQQFDKVRSRIQALSFADDASYSGLQAADMLAYVARRLKTEKRTGAEGDYDTFPVSLYPNLTFGGLHQPKFYDEESLYKLARGTYRHLKQGDQESV